MIDLEPFHIQENASTTIIASTVNLALHEIQQFMNQFPGTNIVAGSIPTDRVKNGAVELTSVSAIGAVSKIAQRNANGDLQMIDGSKLLFQFSD